MSVLIFLIPITLLLGICGLCFFLWTLKTKQYEDLEGAANRILFDDPKKESDKKSK
jgi:cbb3-type cytochrome oxidase maturation protein